MKLALLNGNRFNPWHFRGYRLLRGQPEITAFRAESEIQRYFDERDDGSAGLRFERIHFDTETVNPLARFSKKLSSRFLGREPRIVPFYDRLRGFDLIQSWELFTDWSEQAVIAHEKYGIPLVVTVWDNIPFNMERTLGRRAIKHRVAAAADRFVVHTERSRRMLALEGVKDDRVALINPGVDTDLFSPGPRARGKLGLDDDEFVILFVGWFLPRKGIDFLLLALRELMDDTTLSKRRIRLMAVGSGPGKDRVDRLVDRLGIGSACTFPGSVAYNHMPDVFRAADAFVLPSIATPEWQEQFGMALIEAMACGVPVVTTWSGAIPEIAGDAALLCQPNDFVSLSEAIRRLITDRTLREDLGAAGRARAVGRYALPHFAGALSDLYEGLLH